VTEYEPNRKYTFRWISGPLHLRTSYSFEIASGCTKISIVTQANAATILEKKERLLERKMKKQLIENLALLKGLLEAKEILPGKTAIS
jgi:hypothetical protein